MTLLVTGATGFLGGRVVRRYLALGRSVTALGRNQERLDELEALGARVMARDLATPFIKAEIASLTHIRTIVHAAALSAPFGRKRDFWDANINGTRHMVDLAERINAKRFIHISTPAVYYRPTDQIGLHEGYELPQPINHYAGTKRAAEELVLSRLGRGTVVLRPRGIYGRGDTALLPRLITAAKSGPLPLLRGGVAATDITHVEDVVDAIIAAERAGSSSTRIFNISGGEPVNIQALIERVCGELSMPVRWRAVPTPIAMTAARAAELRAALTGWRSEPRITRYSLGLLAYTQTLDIGRAERNLRWIPRVTLDDGIEEALSGLRVPSASGHAEVAAFPESQVSAQDESAMEEGDTAFKKES